MSLDHSYRTDQPFPRVPLHAPYCSSPVSIETRESAAWLILLFPVRDYCGRCQSRALSQRAPNPTPIELARACAGRRRRPQQPTGWSRRPLRALGRRAGPVAAGEDSASRLCDRGRGLGRWQGGWWWWGSRVKWRDWPRGCCGRGRGGRSEASVWANCGYLLADCGRR